jgi:lysophospholipase L1-like esterase
MKQIFILGASSVYGVGAEHDGWGDLVKSYAHSKMFGPDGVGEQYEVFNFAKSGSTIEFVAETAAWAYQNYARGDDVMTLICVGGNDAKAVDAPDNFVSTPEDFRVKVTDLLELLRQHSQQVVFVSNGFVDETKVSPKRSPFGDGKVSYFTNQRQTMFNDVTKQLCQDSGLEFVTSGVDKDTWIKNYLYIDGLHPGQAGHQKVFEALKPILDTYLTV